MFRTSQEHMQGDPEKEHSTSVLGCVTMLPLATVPLQVPSASPTSTHIQLLNSSRPWLAAGYLREAFATLQVELGIFVCSS